PATVTPALTVSGPGTTVICGRNLSSRSVPAKTVVLPPYVLAAGPAKVRLPGPVFVTPPGDDGGPRAGRIRLMRVEVLLAGFTSAVAADTPAVLLIEVPPDAGWTTRVKLADCPAVRVPTVPITVPPLPTGGVVKLKAGPAVWVSETNVAPAGRGSISPTPWASLGPLLATVSVYVMLPPAITTAGPALVT